MEIKLAAVTEGGVGDIVFGESGNLEKSRNNNSVVGVGNYLGRPIKCSELLGRLDSKNWLSFGLKYHSTVTGDTDVYREILRSPKMSQDLIPQINTGAVSGDLKNGNVVTGYSVSVKDSSDLGEYYRSIFGLEDGADETFTYTSAGDLINFGMSGEEVVNLVTPASDQYISSINLAPFIKRQVGKNLSGTVELGVRYMKSEKDIRENLIFELFSYTKDLELNIPDVVCDIRGDIQVEYFSGEIRLFPKVSEVTECIINNCTVTYGKYN